MPNKSTVSFPASDGTSIRGHFYTPSSSPSSSPTTSSSSTLSTSTPTTPLPCLILSHGWTGLAAWLEPYALHFTSHLPISCLLFDFRGIGESDTGAGQVRDELVPAEQQSDIQDAITYVQSREDVDAERVGIWGSSYSGAHCLVVAATDKRVKACLAQAFLADGYSNFYRTCTVDQVYNLEQIFAADRLARFKGEAPAMLPVTSATPATHPCALPHADAHVFFSKLGGEWGPKCGYKAQQTLRSLEHYRSYIPLPYLHLISPCPLLLVIPDRDHVCASDLQLAAYEAAREPKKLELVQGAGHFDIYEGEVWERIVRVQEEFLRKWLC